MPTLEHSRIIHGLAKTLSHASQECLPAVV